MQSGLSRMTSSSGMKCVTWIGVQEARNLGDRKGDGIELNEVARRGLGITWNKLTLHILPGKPCPNSWERRSLGKAKIYLIGFL